MTEPDTFARPRLGWFLLLDGGIAALTTLSLSQEAYDAASDAVPLPSRSRLQMLLAGTFVIHVVEARVARRRARRHGLPVGRWTRQTFAVGFPSLLAQRKLIEKA
jgi:hypothetical protein